MEPTTACDATAAGTLPNLYLAGVAEAEKGAWPSALHGVYEPDREEVRTYAQEAKTPEGFQAYLDRTWRGAARLKLGLGSDTWRDTQFTLEVDKKLVGQSGFRVLGGAGLGFGSQTFTPEDGGDQRRRSGEE